MHKIKTFKSGMRLVVENIKNYESVSFNMFIKTGSINEDDTNRGISHFIEHMLFKGTKNRSSIEIVTRLDALGASVNAYTSKKETVYYTKSTRESLPECVEILSDMYFNSSFEQKELTREKKVIAEEISMYKDNPSTASQELAISNFYKGTPMEYDIAGTKTSVKNITKEKINKYLSENYVPSKLVLSFAGNITFEEAEEFVQKYFEDNFTVSNQPVVIKTPEVLTIPKTKYVKKHKDNEQAHLVITFPTINVHDERYYDLTVFNAIWGAGMSSRLFQTIREKLGLVYSVYSSVESSNFGGSISIHLGTTMKNVNVAITALRKAMDTLIEEGITQQELKDAKTNLINSLKLRYENTAYVSLYNAKTISTYGKTKEKQEVIKQLQKVTKEDVDNLASKIYSSDNFVISMVGKDTSVNLLKNFKSVK